MTPVVQLFTFFWFSFFCFGFAVLAADAHIFGCNVYEYENGDENPYKIGLFPLRPFLFHFSFFRELLRCYFCTGVWTGALTHILFRDFYGSVYWLWHPPTTKFWIEGLVIASVTGGFICYTMDIVFKLLEKYSTWE